MTSSIAIFHNGPGPLKPGEEDCPYCSGYGYLPVDKQRETVSSGAVQCFKCSGTGKTNNQRR